MSKSRNWAIAALLVPAVVGGCTTPRPTSSLSPATNASPTDPKLLALQFNFCIAQDKAFKIEEPLIAGPIAKREAVSRLQDLEAMASEQTQAFRSAGYDDFAGMMQDWADAFARARTAVEAGADPVKAIRAPVKALRPLLNAIDCEGDA